MLRTWLIGISTNIEKNLRTFVARILTFVPNHKEIDMIQKPNRPCVPAWTYT
jgi:hypothetical protein